MSQRTRIRDWADPVVGEAQSHPRRAGAILIFIALVFVVSGYLGRVPFAPQSGTKVTARIDDSSLLVAGSFVRVRGVDVGEVTAIRHPRMGGPAEIEMRVEDSVARTLRSDARAAVWWRTLFGGRSYVELYPGHARGPLKGTIPLSRTQIQVEFDTLLRTLDTRARPAIQTQLREFRRGLANPRALAQAIDEAPRAARQAAPALQALRGEAPGDLTRLVGRSARAATAIARDERALGRLLDSSQLTFAVIAARRADLAATFRDTPAAMRRVRAESAALPRTLERLDPILVGLLPAARRLEAAARAVRPGATELARTLRVARPLLADLTPTARALEDAGAAGVPLVRELMPTVTRLRREIVPYLRSRDPVSGREVHQLLGPMIAGLDSVSAMFDVHGNAARIAPSLGLNSFGPLPCETYLFDPQSQAQVVCDQLSSLVRAIGRGGRR